MILTGHGKESYKFIHFKIIGSELPRYQIHSLTKPLFPMQSLQFIHCTAVHLKIVGRTHGEMGHKIGKSFSPNCPVQCLLAAAAVARQGGRTAAAVYWHTSNVLTHLKFVQHSFYQA